MMSLWSRLFGSSTKDGPKQSSKAKEAHPPVVPTSPWTRVTVKWYDAKKGFGFLAPDGGGKDIFVHASTLQLYKFKNLLEGQKLEIRYGQGKKGPQAVELKLPD